MKLTGLVAGVAFWLAAAVAAPNASIAAEADDPISIVRDIYMQYAEDGDLIDVPGKYFSASLLELWRAVEAGGEKDVEAALGFPVFNVEGEDETIAIDDVRLQLLAKKYVIASYIVLVQEEQAIAATRKYFQYNFAETPDGWKIDNIDWGPDKKTLRQYLSEIEALRTLQ
jgi:hypothetical protein